MPVETLIARRAAFLSPPAPLVLPAAKGVPVIVTLFLLSIVVPFQISLGPLLLSMNRLLLLLALPLLIARLLRGDAGRLTLTDLGFAAFCGWAALSMAVNHGAATVEYVGILTIETLGAYLIGRVAIRDAATFRALVRVLFLAVLVLLPFALIETVTGRNLLLHAANAIHPSQPEVPPLRRLGLERVQLTLDHPIHVGICLGAVMSLSYAVLGHGRPRARRIGMGGLVGATAFLSLSSGAIIMMLTQVALIAWNGLTRPLTGRWPLLAVLLVALAVAELLTGVFLDLLVNTVAFSQDTAFNRIRIFHTAMDNLRAHPVFGIGRHDWNNLPGLSDSVDMFWMRITMMHGLPAGLLAAAAFLWLPCAVAARALADPLSRACRTGWMITIAALFVALWTVHVWREAYAFILFLLGSGGWLLALEPDPVSEETRP